MTGNSTLDDADNGSIRLNIGLTKKCLARIDLLIESSGLYNSRSEFATCAMRHLVSKYTEVSGAVLKAVENDSEDSRAVRTAYQNRMEKIGFGLEERYREEFEDPLSIQLAIRMKPGFYNAMASLDDLSPRGIQSTCRMALVEYCRHVSEEIRRMHELAEDKGKYAFEEPPKEDADMMSVWDSARCGFRILSMWDPAYSVRAF